MVRAIKVQTSSGPYEVIIADEGLSALAASIGTHIPDGHCVVVTDDTVGALWGTQVGAHLAKAGIQSEWVVLPSGEANKTIDTWTLCVEKLVHLGLKRDGIVVALGGGVLGDIAGFAASAVLRGVKWIQVPTTLLAMVDSSVGGKTGVNLPSGKNLVGRIHQPAHVFMNPEFLSTLSEREYISGLGEVVKTGLLAGGEFWDWLQTHASALRLRDAHAVRDALFRCVTYKAKVVAEDEHEMGPRIFLNAGHTVGHGLEISLGFGTLLHGEAVGLGLIVESRWAVRHGICENERLPQILADLNARLGLPNTVPMVDSERFLKSIYLDKKARAGMMLMPVPVDVGRFSSVSVSTEAIESLVGCMK